MKLKNVLLMGLSLVLVAALAIGGTVAYLSDSDSDVNVMTLGNVKIEQIEQQRDGEGGLKPFVQGQALLPVPGAPASYINKKGDPISGTDDAYKFFAGADGKSLPNALDKVITVKNIGKTDAYVRTVIAFEVVESVNEIKSPGSHIGMFRNAGDSRGNATEGNGNTEWYWTWLDEVVEIDNQKYAIATVLHKGIVKPGEETIPNLTQVYLKSNVDNDYCAKLGGTYEILAVSQAVQADGFADAATALKAAFGDITATDNPWTDAPTEVDSADELAIALAAGNDVKLTDDIAVDDTLTVVGDSVLDLNGKTLTMNGEGREHAIVNYGTLTVKGGTITVANDNGGSAICNKGTLTVEDAILNGAPYITGTGSWPSYVVNNYGTAVFNNTKIEGQHGGVACNEGSKTTLNNVNVIFGLSNVVTTNNGVIAYAGSELTIIGGSYTGHDKIHTSCNSVRVMAGATCTIEGEPTFYKPVWDQNA